MTGDGGVSKQPPLMVKGGGPPLVVEGSRVRSATGKLQSVDWQVNYKTLFCSEIILHSQNSEINAQILSH